MQTNEFGRLYQERELHAFPSCKAAYFRTVDIAIWQHHGKVGIVHELSR
jgi:hypothetical protein